MSPLSRMTLRLLAIGVVLVTALAPPARAQELPWAPIALAGGHVTLGGDASVTIAPEDTGFFNYTDYDRSLTRLMQVDFTGAVKAGDHFSLLTEIRLQNTDAQALALFARIRPWAGRAFDIQIGRVPPTFGAYGRRAYGVDNPLIGVPLGYQYLTSLRPDALPASADQLLNMRGRGWLASYSIGNPVAAHGVPLVSTARWDTGVQVHAATEVVEATAAVTVGTLSDPRFSDNNGGRQVIGRVALHPNAGLIVGVSASRGPFAGRQAASAAGSDWRSLTQQAWGADVEYSRDYYLVRFESIYSAWRMPAVGAHPIDGPLTALATSIEGRYKIRPGFYAAARFDHLGFNEISGSRLREAWDAPVSRIEVGGGYSIQRNLIAKLSYQYNTRDGGRVRSLGLVAFQLLFWL